MFTGLIPDCGVANPLRTLSYSSRIVGGKLAGEGQIPWQVVVLVVLVVLLVVVLVVEVLIGVVLVKALVVPGGTGEGWPTG